MGTWINRYGYTLVKTGESRGFLWWRRTEYEFTLDPDAPMTFAHAEGCYIQPDRHGWTDMGSIPEPLQVLIPKDRYLDSYILHDSACREKGLYFSSTLAGPFVFAPMDSKAVHRLLHECILAEGGGRLEAWLIYRAVRRFGPRFRV